MASINDEGLIERFVRPARCLYSNYSISIDKFKEENGLLIANYELEDLGEDKSYKLYGEFSQDHDGELARELVQTWICDNRLEVSNCIRLALENRKEPFCNWFRSSEEHSSPDELLLYCLAKQNKLHVSIFNNKYVWSTLANHIKYDYFEVVKKSDINLVFIGPRHYAIFRKKKAPATPAVEPTVRGRKRGRGRGRRSGVQTSKTVCRSTSKKSTSKTTSSTKAHTSVKTSQTLASVRKERFGVGSNVASTNNPDFERYGRGKRTRGQGIDYTKLNEGLEQDEPEPEPKRSKYTPVRSGPSLERQTAQTRVTKNPTVTTLSTVKSKKVDNDETANVSKKSTSLIGVQIDPPTVSTEDGNAGFTGVRDAFLGVPDVEADSLLLPDLGKSIEATVDDVLRQAGGTVSEHSQEPSQEEELNAADALLSLSNMPTVSNDDFDFGLDENELLAPIGGNVICEDAAPTQSRLSQVDVDNEIAQFIAQEENDKHTEDRPSRTDLIGVPPPNIAESDTTIQPPDSTSADLIGVQNLDTAGIGPRNDGTTDSQPPDQAERMQDDGGKTDTDNRGVRPKTTPSPDIVDKPGSRGAFRSQLHGLRRGRPKDRAYKCKVCDKSKRSMEALNIHHRKHHDPQKCGVCGKIFVLASTRVHHMYSHYERKYQCDKCSFHCFFKSELDAHKFVHREKPTFKCMYPKCGRWFKRKGELSLHVEVHKSTWYDCKKCDFSTKLIKYLKEHEKCHLKKDDDLPYACGICGERFMWRSGVKRHKEKKH